MAHAWERAHDGRAARGCAMCGWCDGTAVVWWPRRRVRRGARHRRRAGRIQQAGSISCTRHLSPGGADGGALSHTRACQGNEPLPPRSGICMHAWHGAVAGVVGRPGDTGKGGGGGGGGRHAWCMHVRPLFEVRSISTRSCGNPRLSSLTQLRTPGRCGICSCLLVKVRTPKQVRTPHRCMHATHPRQSRPGVKMKVAAMHAAAAAAPAEARWPFA